MNLSISRDSAIGRSVATFLQFLVGLVVVVVGVPGVAEAVTEYVRANLVEVILALGLPTTLVTLVNNLARSGVKNR